MVSTTNRPQLESRISADQYSAIDAVIRRICINDDAVQDAWLEILETKLYDVSSVEQIARKAQKTINNETINNFHKLSSFDKPLKNDDGDEKRTLHDIIPSFDIGIECAEKLKYHKNKTGRVKLEPDMLAILGKKYPALSTIQALRKLMGLPYTGKLNFWKAEEIELLKEKYATTNYKVLEITFGRSRGSIMGMAVRLGLRKDTLRRTPETIFNNQDLVKILHTSDAYVSLLEKNQKIKYYAGAGRIHLIKKEWIIEFLRNYPFEYRHDKVEKSFRPYLPDAVKNWMSIKSAAIYLRVNTHKIYELIKLKKIDCKNIISDIYINISQLEAELKKPRIVKPRKKQPYRVVDYWGKRHYLYKVERNLIDDKEYATLYCKKHMDIPLKVNLPDGQTIINLYAARGYPDCKICLKALTAFNRNV
jgi:hypothetical protein